MEVEWDEPKNRSNQQKHGVSFEEARELFVSDVDYFEISTLITPSRKTGYLDRSDQARARIGGTDRARRRYDPVDQRPMGNQA